MRTAFDNDFWHSIHGKMGRIFAWLWMGRKSFKILLEFQMFSRCSYTSSLHTGLFAYLYVFYFIYFWSGLPSKPARQYRGGRPAREQLVSLVYNLFEMVYLALWTKWLDTPELDELWTIFSWPFLDSSAIVKFRITVSWSVCESMCHFTSVVVCFVSLCNCFIVQLTLWCWYYCENAHFS